MANILITGAAGYIGSYIYNRFTAYGHVVHGIDSDFYFRKDVHEDVFKRDHLMYGDIRDIELIEFVLSQKRIDTVIHLAALVGEKVCRAFPDTARDINVNATQSLIEAIRKFEKDNFESIRFIFPNTNSGYGHSDEEVCTEQSSVRPLSLYAQTKFEAEEIVINQISDGACLRLATVFGISPVPRHELLVNYMINESIFKGKLGIFQGHFKRNYIHLSDIFRALKLLVEFSDPLEPEIYNLGNDNLNMTKMELAQFITSRIPNTIVNEMDGEDPDKRNYYVSSKKFYDYFNFTPTAHIDLAIQEYLSYYANQKIQISDAVNDLVSTFRYCPR